MNPTEHLQAAQRAELECLTGMLDTAIAGFEQLAKLQLQAMREVSHDASAALHEALQARDLQEWATLPRQALRGDGSQMTQYLQQLGEITGAMQVGFSQAVQQAMGRLQQSLQEAGAAQPPRAAAGNGAWQPDWVRESMDLAAQAFQGWTQSQAQAARSLGEQMQRLGEHTAATAAPAQPEQPPARPRAAARRPS